jgi:hypothetical protein
MAGVGAKQHFSAGFGMKKLRQIVSASSRKAYSGSALYNKFSRSMGAAAN